MSSLGFLGPQTAYCRSAQCIVVLGSLVYSLYGCQRARAATVVAPHTACVFTAATCMLGAEENFTQQADMMSELFVHPLIVFPASLNKSVIPSWSEARNIELPKVSLIHIASYQCCYSNLLNTVNVVHTQTLTCSIMWSPADCTITSSGALWAEIVLVTLSWITCSARTLLIHYCLLLGQCISIPNNCAVCYWQCSLFLLKLQWFIFK